MTGATDGSIPVGSVRFLSARLPASLIRRSRIRPLDHLIPSYLPELRWQQALPSIAEPTRSVPPFALALSRLRTLQVRSGAHSRPNTASASLVQVALSCQPAVRSPFPIDRWLLKVPLLIVCTK